MSCSHFHTRLAKEKNTFGKLERPSNYKEKMKFLFRNFEFFPRDMALCKGCVRYHSAESFLPGAWDPTLERTDEEDFGDGLLTIAWDAFGWDELYEIGVNNRQKGAYSLEQHDPLEDVWSYDANFLLDAGDRWIMALEYPRDVVPELLHDLESVLLPYLCRHYEDYSRQIRAD